MNGKCEVLGPGKVRFERFFEAPIETVWAFLVEPDKRAQWLADGDMPLEANRKFAFIFENATLCEPGDERPEKYDSMGDVVTIHGRVLKADPPKLLSIHMFEPGQEEGDGEPSEITFALSERDGGTLLTLTQTARMDRDTQVATAAGWHAHMDVLRGCLESSSKAPSYWRRYTELESEYAQYLPTQA